MGKEDIVPMGEPMTYYTKQGQEPYYMRSENAPRADLSHRFGDYRIEPTRSPLISTDKAVGVLPFPEAYNPWKYIAQPRPYVLQSPAINKYQYYPTVHQVQNLHTKLRVK
jgi:hypothetical protein